MEAAAPNPPDGLDLCAKGSRRITSDAILKWASRSAAIMILLMLGGLVVVLTRASMPAIHEYGSSLVTSSQWRSNELPVFKRNAVGGVVRDEDGEPVVEKTLAPTFGALPFIWGTSVSSAIALIFAVPMSLGAAIFLVRIARAWIIPPVSFLIEFLAAIPSIAYGVWGLFVLIPFLQGGAQAILPNWLAWTDRVPLLTWLVEPLSSNDTTLCFRGVEPLLRDSIGQIPGMQWMFYETITDPITHQETIRQIPLVGRDMFCGGLILAIMIIPIITAVSRDVLRQVPRQQIEGALALGSTWWQSVKEMLHFSRAALFGAIMLGLARAAGETMAITMVIGNANRISPSPFQPAQTMSSLLANNFKDPSSPMHLSAMAAVALVLLAMSLLFNVIARWLVVGKNSRGAAAH